MKKAFGEYRRLARGSLGLSSLWMGGDHLLYVKGSGFLLPFTEEYKRFRYADIQGLVLARTGGLWAGALAYLAGLAVAAAIGFALLFTREPDDIAFLVSALALPLPLAVLALALLIRHLLLGPRCVCEVQTGVKRERLRPVSRMHQGRQVLSLLGDRIHAAQTHLPPAEAAATPHRPMPGERADLSRALRLPLLGLPAFAVQLVGGMLLLAMLHSPNPIVSGACLAVALLGAIPLLIALAGSVRHLSPESVRQALWAQLTSGLILVAVGTVYYFVESIEDPAYTLGLVGPARAFAEIRDLGGLGFYLVFLIGGAAHLLIAVIGIFLHLRWRGRIGGGPPPTQSPPDLPVSPTQQG